MVTETRPTQTRTISAGADSSPAKPVGTFLYPSAASLVERAIRNNEASLSESGALVVDTGVHTGRSPKDKYVVDEGAAHESTWWGEVNHHLDPIQFATLRTDVLAHLDSKETIEIDLRAGADPAYSMPVHLRTEFAWAALFARNLFLPPTDHPALAPFTILHAPTFDADPARHGTRSSTVIALSLETQTIVIAGTRYGGEIKKSIFSTLQYLLPQQGVGTMHCSANRNQAGDVAIFFGLSGTGKTTLSTDGDRILIGDDEHGWNDNGVFNFEGGCYAKVINLSQTAEPGIWDASHRFGTVLENVVMDPEARKIDLDDASKTENTRAAFPITYIPDSAADGRGGHPTNIIFLTADAFGVLPPVSKLTPEQAHDWYLAGYTSKLAGTEKGVTEPQATFSACFGAAFLPLPPVRYAELLDKRIAEHKPSLWLVNTGWTGGKYGVGHRISIAHTRAIIRAILAGRLDKVELETESIFGLHLPVQVPDVPKELLKPWLGWPNYGAYERTAMQLAQDFRKAIG